MKIRFIKDYRFYLPGDTRRLHLPKAGDVMEHDNEELLNKWIARGVAELDVAKPVPVVEEIEITMEDVDSKKETKPAPRARRARKTRGKTK